MKPIAMNQPTDPDVQRSSRGHAITIIFAIFLSTMFQHANATWLNSIGKALKSADEATGAAKAGAKVTSAATHEMPEASRAINAPGLSNADPLASALRRDPLATAQLGRCITKQQQDMNRDSATRHCYSQYQQCVQRQNPLPSLDRPFEACINETNR